MDWFRAVDIYCERTSPAFWAEPVNALTNAAFLLAALWGAVEARRREITSPVVWLLIALAALIGVGSFLFHSYATVWAGLADVVPIWTFVAVFVVVALHRIGGLSAGGITLLVIALVLAATLLVMLGSNGPPPEAPRPPSRLNGSEQYAPAIAALLGFSLLMAWRRHPLRHWVWAATAVFALSLTFRTLDPAVCDRFPLGTHFLWHLLNGLTIGLLLQMLVRTGHGDIHAPPRSTPPAR
ncbi:MAG: ceramidase domain-containing protein [Paracoccaceae bacterium]